MAENVIDCCLCVKDINHCSGSADYRLWDRIRNTRATVRSLNTNLGETKTMGWQSGISTNGGIHAYCNVPRTFQTLLPSLRRHLS